MAEDVVVTDVVSSSTHVPGRSLNQAGKHHFVIDSPTVGEEIGSVDSFLAGISSCGINMVEVGARELGYPLQRSELKISGVRPKANPSSFARIDLAFTLYGVTPDQAGSLVTRYQER
jgi:uncharacterized OsmC-like protein